MLNDAFIKQVKLLQLQLQLLPPPPPEFIVLLLLEWLVILQRDVEVELIQQQLLPPPPPLTGMCKDYYKYTYHLISC